MVISISWGTRVHSMQCINCWNDVSLDFVVGEEKSHHDINDTRGQARKVRKTDFCTTSAAIVVPTYNSILKSCSFPWLLSLPRVWGWVKTAPALIRWRAFQDKTLNCFTWYLILTDNAVANQVYSTHWHSVSCKDGILIGIWTGLGSGKQHLADIRHRRIP